MSYKPTTLDVAADLRRAVYASFSKGGFRSKNFSDFFGNAIKNLGKVKEGLNKNRLLTIETRIKKAKNKSFSAAKRREDLLTASIFLLK